MIVQFFLIKLQQCKSVNREAYQWKSVVRAGGGVPWTWEWIIKVMITTTAAQTDCDARQTIDAVDGDLWTSVDVVAMTTTTSHSSRYHCLTISWRSLRGRHLDMRYRVCLDVDSYCSSVTVTGEHRPHTRSFAGSSDCILQRVVSSVITSKKLQTLPFLTSDALQSFTRKVTDFSPFFSLVYSIACSYISTPVRQCRRRHVYIFNPVIQLLWTRSRLISSSSRLSAATSLLLLLLHGISRRIWSEGNNQANIGYAQRSKLCRHT